MNRRDLTDLMKRLTQIQSCIKVADIESQPGFIGILSELFKVCCLPNTKNNPKVAWLQHLKIRSILEKSEFEPPFSKTISERLSDFDRESKIRDMIAWVKEDVNAVVDNLNVVVSSVEGEKQFGLKLKDPVRLGQSVARIPSSKIYYADKLLEQKQLASLVENDPILSNMPNVLLAVGLLIEMYKNNSKWSVYFESFPASYSNCCYFSAENMATLSNSAFFLDALNQWKSIVRQYAYIHMKFFEFQNYSQLSWIKEMNLEKRFCFDDYCWAVATIMTRANSIPSPLNKDKLTLALIPVLDMCNHKETITSIDYDVSTDQAVILAPANMLTDEELFIFYGARPTAFHLIYNGFYLDNNQQNYILFNNQQYVDPTTVNSRHKLLDMFQLVDNFTFPLTNKITAWLGDLRIFYRIIYCADKEYQQIVGLKNFSDIKEKFNSQQGISESSEQLSMQTFIDHLNLRLTDYQKQPFSLSTNPSSADGSDSTQVATTSSTSISLNVTCKKINVWCQLLVSLERDMLHAIISDMSQLKTNHKSG